MNEEFQNLLGGASSDDEAGFTLSIEDSARGLGASAKQLEALASGTPELVSVELDSGETEKHLTRQGILNVAASVATARAEAFAEACRHFTPDW